MLKKVFLNTNDNTEHHLRVISNYIFYMLHRQLSLHL